MPLAPPTYLRLGAPSFDGAYVCVREHRPPRPPGRAEGPLVLLTFHPGFIAGSYDEWDYFAQVAAQLFRQLADGHRLRAFTLNHPGYAHPPGATIDRFHLEAYSIRRQPEAMRAAMTWLLNGPLAGERDVVWVAYGHSMGGLALSQCQTEALVGQMAAAGRRLRPARVLSAPAFCLQPQARAVVGQLDALHALKLTLGRLPLYEPLATGLYRSFAPFFYRLSAPQFSIGGLGGFTGFRRLNPFVLLEQGRELLRLEAADVCGPDTLADAHVILARQDGMIDCAATQMLIDAARRQGHRVYHHDVDSTHLLELDAPDVAAGIVRQVIAEAVA
ncbi:MAG: hypothetical protein KBG73_16835 [Candidatus Promineofilum sp.]|nr:hypothetical protein [Promineifilum sp.]